MEAIVSEKISASHILIAHADGDRSRVTRSKEEALETIEKIKAELDDGGEFAALAGEHSDCPSGKDGGDLGSFGRHAMVKEFEDAAFALEVGDASGVVETPFGYHLIQRTG
jgi:parvulin-like peptidyl-prolyl isomerase